MKSANINNQYFCEQCKHNHKSDSKVGIAHRQYNIVQPALLINEEALPENLVMYNGIQLDMNDKWDRIFYMKKTA